MITGYEYAHHPYYPVIVHFVSPFIYSDIPDVSTYEKTRRQRSTTIKSRKSTNYPNGQKRKSKNKRRTQATQDDEVSDTDTEQQTSEQKTFFFYVNSGRFTFCCKISALTQIFRDFNLLGNIKTIFRLSHYQLVEI